MNGYEKKNKTKGVVSFVFSGLSFILTIVYIIFSIQKGSSMFSANVEVIMGIVCAIVCAAGTAVYLLSGLLFVNTKPIKKSIATFYAVMDFVAILVWVGVAGVNIYWLSQQGAFGFFLGSIGYEIAGIVFAIAAITMNIIFGTWMVGVTKNSAVIPGPRPTPRPMPPISDGPISRPVRPISGSMPPTPCGPISVKGIVEGISGAASGIKFSITGNSKVVMGRNPQSCNFIVDYPQVSNVHCSIRFNPNTGSYIIKDHSSNGTFVNNVKLQKNIPTEFPSGTIVSLADGTNRVRLG